MKKLMLVLILASATALGLARSSHAVQLQQGWFAWLRGCLSRRPVQPEHRRALLWNMVATG